MKGNKYNLKAISKVQDLFRVLHVFSPKAYSFLKANMGSKLLARYMRTLNITKERNT